MVSFLPTTVINDTCICLTQMHSHASFLNLFILDGIVQGAHKKSYTLELVKQLSTSAGETEPQALWPLAAIVSAGIPSQV